MRLGIHCSVGKGLKNTIKEAVELGCETIQIFSRSPRAWARKEFNLDEIREFKKALKENRIFPLIVHMLYLNVAEYPAACCGDEGDRQILPNFV
ncbi:MAG: hypothetical protein AB1349_11250 [Elusimicrobiota bacterium]